MEESFLQSSYGFLQDLNLSLKVMTASSFGDRYLNDNFSIEHVALLLKFNESHVFLFHR